MNGLERAFGTKMSFEWILPKRCQKELVIEYEYYSQQKIFE